MTEQTDGLERLAEVLARKRSGWHWHENSETGQVALFPETAKSEHEWETRATLMHDRQKTIRLDEKPVENALAARKGQVVRGD
jgi:hypothetical protein